MATSQLPLGDILKPVFRARLVLYVFGIVVAVILVATGGPLVILPMTVSGALIAWWQLRAVSVPTAWLFDSLIAVGIAEVQETPLGVAIVIGWGAVIGLTDTNRSWIYPAGSGAAAAAATMLAQPPDVPWSAEAVLRIVAVMVIAIFFVIMFRRVGHQLRSDERELRAFFQRIPVALTRTSPDGRLMEFNHAVSALFDNPTLGEQVAGRYADPGQRQAFVDALLREGVVQNFETSFKGVAGDRVEALISANAVQDDAGGLRYIETAITDITALRRTESERELLALVIDSTSDLVALGNWDGSIRYANAAARQWLARYITDDEYVHSSQPLSSEDYESLQEALTRTGEWAGILTIDGRDGQRIVNGSFQVLEMAGDYTVASIARDVTDEVETQRKLEDLVRAKDELVASISHEIRTPLSVVLGLASELRDRHDDFDGATHDEIVTLIAEQGQEMAHIVEDLLIAARADAGSIILDLTLVDLEHEVEMTLRSIAEADRPLQIDNAVTGACWGDPGRVRQILRNLIVNARRHGGDQVRLASYAAAGRVSIEVVDDGAGVPVDSVATVFEPFARAREASSQPSSIGLGLSVSRDLANRMGGDLTYMRRGSETVFTLTLPGSIAAST